MFLCYLCIKKGTLVVVILRQRLRDFEISKLVSQGVLLALNPKSQQGTFEACVEHRGCELCWGILGSRLGVS